MSASQHRGRKKNPVQEETILDEILNESQEQPVEAAPEPKRPEAAMPKVSGTSYLTGLEVDIAKLLRFIARIKTGGFGLYGNGANFGNHMVKDCFKVNGKALNLEEASELVRPFMNVQG